MGNNTVLITLGVILAVLISGVVGFAIAPDAKTIEVIKQVPVEKIVTQNVTVEKIVKVDTILSDKLNDAVDAFLKEYEDNDDTPAGYDFDQLSKKTIEKDYSIEVTKDTTVVNFDVTLKFLDKDTEEKLYKDYSVSVEFDNDGKDDPVVDY